MLKRRWNRYRNRCLQCKRQLPDRKVRRWCSNECEDYYVQDSI